MQNNLTIEEYLTMPNLQSDRNVITKSADKGFAVVVWDRNDFLQKAEKKLRGKFTSFESKVIEKYFS